MRFKERVVAALVNTKGTLGTPHHAPSYDLAILIDRVHPKHLNFLLPPSSSVQQAPLFFSATDEFREEDDETEREREIADFYALQRSRRHFGDSNLKESSELDDSERSGFEEESSPYNDRPGKGIKSSWRGEEGVFSARPFPIDSVAEAPEHESASPSSPGSSKVRGHLVDIGLEDSLRADVDDDQVLSNPGAQDPPVQRFRERELLKEPSGPSQHGHTVEQAELFLQDTPRPPSSASSFPTSVSPLASENTVHDAFWGQLFLISLAGLFASAFLVYLHTSTPSGDKSRWGDTIYMTVHGSFFLLGIYTIVSILVSLLWLALLRSYVRLLVHVILVAVPTILYSFSLYPFISSFKGPWHGTSIQDKAMRWGSAVPFLIATMWIYNIVRGRQSIGKAIGILEFACRILAANPELLALGLGALVCVVSWTWIWMLMFTRVFLGGHLVSSKSFIIDVGSWWLGIYFIVVYLWSIGVIAGIQRAVTAATVSQWYFHRLTTPAPTSRQIVQAAVVHAATTLFGTISLSRLLGLLVRLPLLLLPGRISSLLSLDSFAASCRFLLGLSQMAILAPSAASTSLHPRSYSQSPGNSESLLSYRLSKLILYAARFMMSLALGFGGWVTTARSLTTSASSGTIRGSLYAYVVGLIAGTIGWTTLGAMEGVIADIVDAAVICWASEVGIYGREARYCREAGWLFGDSQPRFGHEYQEV
ncbi:hypothetical protein N7453_005223 [Penicillium expansum]|nr:hypothetical protein N7453_005223 [Penicillium expansum]